MRNIRGLLPIQFFLTLILITFSTTPFLTNNYISIMLYVAIVWIVVSFCCLHLQRFVIYNGKLFFLVSLWLGIIISLHIFGYSKANIGAYFNSFIFYIYIYSLMFSERMYTYGMKKVMLIYSLLLISLNLIDNIYLNTIHKYASTLIYTTTSEGGYLKTLNIGATDFSTMVFLFSGIVLIRSFYINGLVKKIFMYLLVVCAGYLIAFQHARATTTLLYVLMLLLIILSHYFETHSMTLSSRVLLFFLFLILIFALFVPFLEFLATVINSDRLVTRLNALIAVVRGNVALSIDGDTLSRRFYLIYTTLQTFFSSIKNFFFGTGYNLVATSSMQEMISLTGVGYHCELIDVLGCYGIIGGFFVYSILYECKKILCSIFEKNNNMIYKYVYIIFVIYGFLNIAFTPQIGVVVFVVLPFSSYIISAKEGR